MKNYSMSELVDSKGFLTCPICGKEFKFTDNTKYIAGGGYTCSWKCFLTEVKRREEEKNNSNKRRIQD